MLEMLYQDTKEMFDFFHFFQESLTILKSPKLSLQVAYLD